MVISTVWESESLLIVSQFDWIDMGEVTWGQDFRLLCAHPGTVQCTSCAYTALYEDLGST